MKRYLRQLTTGFVFCYVKQTETTMASVRSRENTFRIDLTNFSKRPTFEEIHKFVHETLGLTVDHVVRLQMNHAQNCVQIKCRDLQTAQDVVEKHHEKHELEVNKCKVKVRLVMEDGGVEVKLHDLSENIRNEEIVAFLKQYGEVIAIKDQVWGDNYPLKGIPTGVRVVKMVLRRHIKSFVTIQSEQTLVTYRNQPHTCRHCTNPSHPGSTCVENKKLLAQKSDLNDRLKAAAKSTSNTPVNFASVVNNSGSSLMPHFVALNGSASTSPSTISVASETNHADSSPSASNQTGGGALASTSTASVCESTELPKHAEQRIENTEQRSTEAPTVGGIGAKQPTSDQSTHQVTVTTNESSSTDSVSLFKIPSNPPKTLNFTMEISDSDSCESQDSGSFQKVKRRGRPKKQKLDSVLP